MKKIIFTLLFAYCIGIKAQTPQPVYSFVTQMKPLEWYKEQAELWQKELRKNKKNAFAWYNYYIANRNLNRMNNWNDFKPKLEEKIVEDMGKEVPNSFEYNLCKWKIGGFNLEYISYLNKAEALGAGRTEHLADMLTKAEIERNNIVKNKYAMAWYNSNLVSPGMLYANYNVLIGLKPNAILLANGDNDTYPIWILQSQGIRTDVVLMNMSLLFIDKYRDTLFAEYGIDKWEHDFKSLKVDSNGLSTDKEDYNEKITNRFYQNITSHIAKNKQKRNVYLPLTCGDQPKMKIEDKLYLIGMAYEYSEERIDNIATMKRNFEQLYVLDYIDKIFYKDISAEIVINCNRNYEVPMIKLYEHYKEAGDRQKQDWIKAKLLHIIKNTEEEKDLLNYINQP